MLAALQAAIIGVFAAVFSVCDTELVNTKGGRLERANGAAIQRAPAGMGAGAELSGEEHEFYGRHLLASYMGCAVEALADRAGLRRAVHEAAAESGATVLGAVEHVFPEGGYSLVLLLSESHASIHTYPEHGACFVDLFTCGRTCSAERFDRVLRARLRPKQTDSQIICRDRKMTLDEVRSI